jgi:hypothetical protein
VQTGSRLRAGSVIGTVQERRFADKIMTPLNLTSKVEVTWIQEGSDTANEPIAIIKLENDKERVITLKQRWPVRKQYMGTFPCTIFLSRFSMITIGKISKLQHYLYKNRHGQKEIIRRKPGFNLYCLSMEYPFLFKSPESNQ